MRVLGVDYGTKTIGLAISDPSGLIAQPLASVKRDEGAWMDEILKAIASFGVELVIVGLPINMDGTEGGAAKAVRTFIDRLRARTPVRVEPWDERLSTAAAQRALIEGDVSREARKKVVDKVAAAYILQGYLDGLRSTGAGLQPE